MSFYLSLSGIAGIKAAIGIFGPADFLGEEPLLLEDRGSDALGGEFAWGILSRLSRFLSACMPLQVL